MKNIRGCGRLGLHQSLGKKRYLENFNFTSNKVFYLEKMFLGIIQIDFIFTFEFKEFERKYLMMISTRLTELSQIVNKMQFELL